MNDVTYFVRTLNRQSRWRFRPASQRRWLRHGTAEERQHWIERRRWKMIFKQKCLQCERAEKWTNESFFICDEKMWRNSRNWIPWRMNRGWRRDKSIGAILHFSTFGSEVWLGGVVCTDKYIWSWVIHEEQMKRLRQICKSSENRKWARCRDTATQRTRD